MLNKRRGVTLADSLCGLFIITLGLSIYSETNQVMHHQFKISNHQLIQERQHYEQQASKTK